MSHHDEERRDFGLVAILPTLYDENGSSVSTQAMTQHVEMMVDKGYTDFLTTGSYGEFQFLSDAERVRVVEIVRSVDSSLAIMACAAHVATQSTIELSDALAAAGATSVMIAPPPGLEMRDSEIVDHFALVAAHVDTPLVIYNNPAFGVDLSVSVLSEITPFAHAIKQGTRDIVRLVGGIRAIRDAGGETQIYTASDGFVLSAICLDVNGLTSTNCSVFPDAFMQFSKAVAANDVASAARIHGAMDAYWRAIGQYGQPRSVKEGVAVRMGRPVASMRRPFRALADPERAGLRAAIEESDRKLAEVLGA